MDYLVDSGPSPAIQTSRYSSSTSAEEEILFYRDLKQEVSTLLEKKKRVSKTLIIPGYSPREIKEAIENMKLSQNALREA